MEEGSRDEPMRVDHVDAGGSTLDAVTQYLADGSRRREDVEGRSGCS